MISDMKTRRLVTVGSLLFAAIAPGLVGQTPEQRLQNVYTPEEVAAIQALVDEATRSGVPSAPLYDKALEGAAKRVPAARVMPALREYSGRMERAQGLLGGTREAAWVVAGADALRRGVAPEALTAIGAEAGRRTPMALVVMGDLLEAGVPARGAMDVMREALARTTSDDGLLEVPTALRRLVREGALAPDAAGRILAAMRGGVALRGVRNRPSDRPSTRPPARPVPRGSDPTRVRPGG